MSIDVYPHAKIKIFITRFIFKIFRFPESCYLIGGNHCWSFKGTTYQRHVTEVSKTRIWHCRPHHQGFPNSDKGWGKSESTGGNFCRWEEWENVWLVGGLPPPCHPPSRQNSDHRWGQKESFVFFQTLDC